MTGSWTGEAVENQDVISWQIIWQPSRKFDLMADIVGDERQ